MNAYIKKKVNGIGLAGRIISTIAVVMMCIACGALLTLGICLAVMPREAITVGVKSDLDINVRKELLDSKVKIISGVELDDFNADMKINGKEFVDWKLDRTADGLTVSGSTERIQFDLSRLSGAAFSGLVYCAALLVVFVFLNRLSTAFHRCDSPFDDLVIKRMNVFAWVLVGCAAVASIAEGIVNSLLERSVDLSFAMNPSGMSSGFEFSISFGPILIALIVLFLTVIFRYGAKLQKESDETL